MPLRERARRRDVERFSDWSDTYDRSPLQRVFFEPVQAQLLEVLDRLSLEPDLILDVGCGTGRLLARLSGRYGSDRLVGIDAAPGMAEVAGHRGFPVTVGVAERMPFLDGSVDLVVSTVSFHHWSDQERGLAEVARILRAGGCFVLVDIIVPPWLRPWFALARTRDRFHTPQELDGMFTKVGLDVVSRSNIPGMWGAVAVTVGRPN